MKTALISIIIIILLVLAALLYSVGHRLMIVRSGISNGPIPLVPVNPGGPNITPGGSENPGNSGNSTPGQPATTTPATIQTSDVAGTGVLTALHQYVNGVHTLVGRVQTPTPCHVLNDAVIVGKSLPENVEVNFSLTTNPNAICVQTLSSAPFRIQFNALPSAIIQATWNGQPVRLNLVQVAPGQNI